MPVKILHQHKPEAAAGLWTMLVEGKEWKEEKAGTRSGPKAICMRESGEK